MLMILLCHPIHAVFHVAAKMYSTKRSGSCTKVVIVENAGRNLILKHNVEWAAKDINWAV